MSAACPYCRAKIADDEPSLVCEGCGTMHHADCYAENGGCTIFGCSKAPADEPKLSVTTPELVAVATSAPVIANSAHLSPPPPPSPGGSEVTIAVAPGPTPSTDELRFVANSVVPSIFGGFGATSSVAIEPPPPKPKSRTTYILLGALLGALGAHSFYAGYHKKGGIQLAITLLSLGFASPMSWIWAVIDICTINQDNLGVQFES
jgi:TM2 domain-containing membrane protein YozV